MNNPSSRSSNPTCRRRRIRPADLAAVDHAALPVLGALCSRWLPGGRRVGSEYVVAGLRGGPGSSCKIRLTGPKAGVFRDFATGESGHGAVALASAVHHINYYDAALLLGEALGIHF